MRYVIQPKFARAYLFDHVRLVMMREIKLQRYVDLGKAKEEARAMVDDDGAVSATVYEQVPYGGKQFKLRWERVGNKIVMVNGLGIKP